MENPLRIARDQRSDLYILFLTRGLRQFGYGCLAIFFLTYLQLKDFTNEEISMLQTLVVVGDVFITLVLTSQADRFGRRRTLIIGALIKFLAGLIFAQSQQFTILLFAGAVGVISVAGGQIGPFRSIQESSLSQIVENCTFNQREIEIQTTKVFGYYTFTRYIAKALGMVFCGYFIEKVSSLQGFNQKYTMSVMMLLYSFLGGAMSVCYYFLRPQIQGRGIRSTWSLSVKAKEYCAGIRKSSLGLVLVLASLFAVDGFGGGLIVPAYVVYAYGKRYYFSPSIIGIIFFFCNLSGGFCVLYSSKLVDKGWTSLKLIIYASILSNICLMMIIFCSPELSYLAVILLLMRYSITQMKLLARQAYTSLLVSSSQRNATNKIISVTSQIGMSLAFPVVGIYFKKDSTDFWFMGPFLLAGSMRLLYDFIMMLLLIRVQNKQHNQNTREEKWEVEELFEEQIGVDKRFTDITT